MTPVSNFHLLDKARRRHRRNKSLPELIAGSGKIDANGVLKATLTAVTGETFTYRFVPRTEWMAELVDRRPAPSAKPRPVVSPEAELMAAVGATLNALVRVERAAQPKPNIAAE